MMENSWLNLITVVAYRLPILIIWLIGAYFAIARWQRNPRASMLVLCACVLSAGVTLFQIVGQVVLVRMVTMQQLGRIFMAMGILSSTVHALAIGLLISAAFVDRSMAASPGSTKLPPICN